MQKVIKFGDMTITDLPSGRVHFDYGLRMGSETFPNRREACEVLDKWADTRLNIVSKELEAICKLKRFTRRGTM